MGGDQAGAHAGRSPGVEMDLHGVATAGHVLAAHRPVGAGGVFVVDRAEGGAVVLHAQAPPLAFGHHRLGHHHVPVELVADAGVHRWRPGGHCGAAGAGARDVLGVGVAGQHQDWGGGRQVARTDPIAAQAAAGAGEGIAGGTGGVGADAAAGLLGGAVGGGGRRSLLAAGRSDGGDCDAAQEGGQQEGGEAAAHGVGLRWGVRSGR
jgi:hypothetical protein